MGQSLGVSKRDAEGTLYCSDFVIHKDTFFFSFEGGMHWCMVVYGAFQHDGHVGDNIRHAANKCGRFPRLLTIYSLLVLSSTTSLVTCLCAVTCLFLRVPLWIMIIPLM
jgi:hypothetical protein